MYRLRAISLKIMAIILCLNAVSCEEVPPIYIEDMTIEVSNSIYLGSSNMTNILVGSTGVFTVQVSGHHDADFVPTYSWESSDPSVIEVDTKTGSYVARSIGECTITVTNVDVFYVASCDVNVIAADVTDISLDVTEKILRIGEELTLGAVITPEYAAHKDIEWSSSNPDVAAVDNKGTVTAIRDGRCNIYAKVSNLSGEGSPLTALCTIEVIPNEVEGVSLNATVKTIYIGEKFILHATVTPEDATYKDVAWSSSDSSVASVDAEGTVTALKEGTCRIYAKSGNVKAECMVTVLPIEVESISLDITEMSLSIGEEFTIHATVTPEDATHKDLVWSSSDSSVASVDAEGTVTALKEGTCRISVTASNGQVATCLVTVRCIEVENISLDVQEKTLEEGETFILQATIAPENATYKDVEWSSSDSSVASVDAEGKVTALKVGECLIYARASSKEAQCRVIVKPISVKEVKFVRSSMRLLVGESAIAEYQISPSNALVTDVEWRIEDEYIASVSNDGTVTCNGIGTTTLIVTVNGEYSAECVISGCTIEAFVSLRFGSSMISSVNGNMTGQVECFISNNSSQAITIKSIQLIDSYSGKTGNEMSADDAIVEAHSSKGYVISINFPMYKPIFRWKYAHDGNEYVTEIKFDR